MLPVAEATVKTRIHAVFDCVPNDAYPRHAIHPLYEYEYEYCSCDDVRPRPRRPGVRHRTGTGCTRTVVPRVAFLAVARVVLTHHPGLTSTCEGIRFRWELRFSARGARGPCSCKYASLS